MTFDIAIIGAGPAGMEAALLAKRHTDKILVLDSRPEPGGNVYAYVASNARNFPDHFRRFDASYTSGLMLVERFLGSGVDYRPCSSVWHLDGTGQVAYRGPDGAHVVQARKIILCTGAYERPLPVPGWTLPGIMGVGAAQIALKSSAVLPQSPTVIIGNGPLPLLYARQLRRAGGKIDAFIIPKPKQTAPIVGAGLRAALISPTNTARGLSMLVNRTLAGTRVVQNATSIGITGQDKVEGVQFEASGKRIELPAQAVLLHDGIIPDINISAGSGLDIDWSIQQQSWRPALDGTGQSSVQNIFVAGDAGGIAGATAAHLSGKRAALAAMVSLGLAAEGDLVALTSQTGRDLRREIKLRTVLDQLYPTAFSNPSFADELTICRCEGVTAGDIRREIADMKNVNVDPNRLKSVLRCGMGPCQGRNCAQTVARLVTGELGTDIDRHSLPRTRAPYTQITLGEMANLSMESGDE